MSTDTDLLLERRRARRQGLLWKVVAAVAVTALLAVLGQGGQVGLGGLSGGDVGAGADGDHIARLNIEGIIFEDRVRNALIEKLKDDDTVRAVVVYVNSPGGAVVGGEDLYRNLRDLAAVKPVVALMGTVAASAGYMTAIGADRIYAREGTITGSIGVLFEATEFSGLLKKMGVKAELVKAHR